MKLPGNKRSRIFTDKDLERFHQQLTNMLVEIEADHGNVKNPAEIDIQVRMYYGRWGQNCAMNERAFSRYNLPVDGYMWDEGDNTS